MNFDLQRYNADFRYRMVRVRENAESVALYRGEADEKRRLDGAFGRIFGTWWDFMRYNKRLTWFTSFYAQAAGVFPLVVASPRYFLGQIPLGVLTQTAGAFGQVQGSLSWFVDVWPTLADWKATIDRLTTFGETMEAARGVTQATSGFTIERVDGRVAQARRRRGGAAGWPAPARARRPRGPAGRSARDPGAIGQRQDHAVSRARRLVAVRQGA